MAASRPGRFAKLDLAPSDDDNRRVLAVLAYGAGLPWFLTGMSYGC